MTTTRLSRTRPISVMAFLLPSFVGFVLFILYPAVASVGLSFFKFSGRFLEYIGLTNYYFALTTPSFWNSIWVTIRFVGFSTVWQLLIALTLALMLNRAFRGRTLFRSLFFLPSILSSLAIGIAFMLILHPSRGPMNQLLETIGVGAQPWLSSRETALGTLVMVNVWQNSGYYMILYLAGLQAINSSLYEAATIDGASRWQQTIRITIPLLAPTTFLCLIMSVIKSFQVFDHVYIMTGMQAGGGPAGSTSLLVFNIYKEAFVNFRMGYASMLSVFLLLIVLTFTIFNYRMQRNWVTYDV